MARPPDDSTRLLAAIADAYALGRRYRAIEAACEDAYFGRTLDLGSRLRREQRARTLSTSELADIHSELEQILTDLQQGIAGVRGGALYRETRQAFEASDEPLLARRIPELFAGLLPFDDTRPLAFPVPVLAPRGVETHFLAPSACARRIIDLAITGIPAATEPPELGADDVIRAVVLEDAEEPSETPVAVILDARQSGAPRFRFGAGGQVVCHRPHLKLPLFVRLLREHEDEWWATGPLDYDAWTAEIEAALLAAGIAVTRA